MVSVYSSYLDLSTLPAPTAGHSSPTCEWRTVWSVEEITLIMLILMSSLISERPRPHAFLHRHWQAPGLWQVTGGEWLIECVGWDESVLWGVCVCVCHYGEREREKLVITESTLVWGVTGGRKVGVWCDERGYEWVVSRGTVDRISRY